MVWVTCGDTAIEATCVGGEVTWTTCDTGNGEVGWTGV